MEYKSEAFFFEGKEYQIHIKKKAMQSMSMRLSSDLSSIEVHAPYFVSKKEILAFVNKRGPALIKRVLNKSERLSLASDLLFGEKEDHTLSETELKEALYNYVSTRQVEYEKVLNTPHYVPKVRKMTSRYGVNNLRSQSITYAVILAHFSKEIIDAIIIHELAHHFVRNHQKAFYDIVYKHCPDYDARIKKLKGRVFK